MSDISIPERLQALVRRIAAEEFHGKHLQVLHLDRVYSAEHPDVVKAHQHLDEARELFQLVDPLEYERVTVPLGIPSVAA